MSMNTKTLTILLGVGLLTAACGGHEEERAAPAATTSAPGRVVAVADTTIDATLDAAGVAQPIAQATLGTKLMGTVTEVLVREGDQVAAGQPLVRIDARDLAAKRSQVGAGVAEADAVLRDAETQTARIRALYADSAATRAQLDAAETGLARARAAVRQASAGAAELEAVADYSIVRAPFAGVVTRRFVDPGAFAAPGAPLVAVQDGRRLRITATVSPEAARLLRRGATVVATIESFRTTATVEGVVPSAAGNVYTVNAIVENASATMLPGSAATLSLPQGARRAVLVPAAAIRREGDLTGVTVRGPAGDELRWVRLGATAGDGVEVLAGLKPGDRIVVPAVTPARVATTAEER
jgi:RND family efflux transporter MFP subunit